jgi:hypothetical protein
MRGIRKIFCLWLFPLLSSCCVIEPDCPINKTALFKAALARAGSNTDDSFVAESQDDFLRRYPDCCVLLKFSNGGDPRDKRDSDDAVYYVDIVYKYTNKKYSAEFKQPYRVEFDQCGQVVWDGFPYGG